MRRYAICLATLLMTGATPVSASECHVDRFTGRWGMDVNVRMVAPSGTLCKIKMGSGVTSGFSISSQAQHGIASITESRIVYKSAAGFVGEDQFIYEKTGHSYDYHKDLPVDGLSHYIVSVEVVP